MTRQHPALGPPPPDLSRFPRTRLRAEEPVYRAHSVGNSPWWFSADLSGRFDLIQPHGTCYLATDIATALRERFGHDLVAQGVVTFAAARRTQVSSLHLPTPRWLANTCSPNAASFGMTREIGTCASYEMPQAWAAALFATGRQQGIRYQSRFTTGAAPNAAALFDTSGRHDWITDPTPRDGVAACAAAGITVAHPPTRRQIRILTPTPVA